MDYFDQKTDCFTNNEIMALVGFQGILKRIHDRLISDGYIIKDGEIIAPKSVENRSQLC